MHNRKYIGHYTAQKYQVKSFYFIPLVQLYVILHKSLEWNKSHLKCFALIMLVIILTQTCNLSSASKALPIKCFPHSLHRRIQRFLTRQNIDYSQISRLIFNIFSFDKVQLTLDRTNWKWGKRNINILMLAILYRGLAIPILWTLLNKRGNSDTKERIALIQRFISIFGKDRIVNVFADREFIGEQWFTWLIETTSTSAFVFNKLYCHHSYRQDS